MVHIGQINLSKDVVISDPCYQSGKWCAIELNNVKPGIYDCFIDMETFVEMDGQIDKVKLTEYGHVKDLVIIHTDFFEMQVSSETKEENKILVDSGTCGVFDKTYYDKYHLTKDDRFDEWYYKFVSGIVKCGQINFNNIENLGIWSESGYGDGMYDVYTTKNKQQEVVTIRISFEIDEDI